MRLEGSSVAIVVSAGQSPGEGVGNGRATALTFAREGAKDAVRRLQPRGSAEETVGHDQEEPGHGRRVIKADVTKAAGHQGHHRRAP